jgi:hypothetical protein
MRTDRASFYDEAFAKVGTLSEDLTSWLAPMVSPETVDSCATRIDEGILVLKLCANFQHAIWRFLTIAYSFRLYYEKAFLKERL